MGDTKDVELVTYSYYLDVFVYLQGIFYVSFQDFLYIKENRRKILKRETLKHLKYITFNSLTSKY